jgi:hypothetical protein
MTPSAALDGLPIPHQIEELKSRAALYFSQVPSDCPAWELLAAPDVTVRRQVALFQDGKPVR